MAVPNQRVMSEGAAVHVRYAEIAQHTSLGARRLLAEWVGSLAGLVRPFGAPATVRLDNTCPRCGRPHGRPRVVGPPAAVGWQVSVAHAGPVVALAATLAGPVGIDVEREAAADFEGFEDVALSAGESARHQPTASSRARVWVRKEAVLKATGHGLTVDPRLVEVSPADEPAGLRSWRGPDVAGGHVVEGELRGQLLDLPAPAGHAGAVCVLTPSPVRVVVDVRSMAEGLAGPARHRAAPTPR